jgi:S-DNA-T family DNA segregation ATPase FtsK/SpoIIIE
MAKKRRKKYRRRRKSIPAVRLKKQTVYTVGAIWMWIFAIIITFSFFAEGYLVEMMRSVLWGRFGWTYFFLPPILITMSFLFFKTKSALGKPNIPSGIIIIAIALMGLFQSGYYGVLLWSRVKNAVSPVFATIVFLACIMMGIIVLFNTSLEGFIGFVLVRIQSLFSAKHGRFTRSGEKPDVRLKINDKSQLTIRSPGDEKRPGKEAPALAVDLQKQVREPRPSGTGEMKLNSPVNKFPPKEGFIWEYPPLNILSDGPGQKADRGDIRKNAGTIEDTLESFGIAAKVEEVNPGPAVTQYAIRLSLGTKVSKITSLSSDLALALAAPTGQVRIEAPIPGRHLVGVEIPNRGLEFVTLKRMLQSDPMKKSKSKLAVALGLDVSGHEVLADIGKMPHVLVAGTTGSGKSVLVNSWICSLLFRTTPQEVKLILVDPKRVELTGYNGVPHLLTPVIVEPEKILSALHWAMHEMDNRYKQFVEVGVRNIDGFNELSGFQAMPYIVILIDELADLMVYAPAEVEDAICRIAQMARATGIHLVLATQRPSVDVITGLIKANIPARIAFNVSSMVDSRVIIDMPGAEKLLGRGDMLFIPPDQSKPSRIQGTFVSEQEVRKVVDFMKSKNLPVEYAEDIINQPISSSKRGQGITAGGDGKDPLFDDAVRLICQHDRASASLLQRRLSIGYARAARILDQLEDAGIIGPGEGAKPRDVLVKSPEEYFAQQGGGDSAQS